jgi:very-short-patch-repair endonuclease
LAIREALGELKKDYNEEHLLEDTLFKTDFYVPSAKLAIEINGKTHYYPYTTRFNNFTNLKMKSLRSSGHNVLNLNSWMLEGFIRNDNRAGLKDLISKTIATYENKKE